MQKFLIAMRKYKKNIYLRNSAIKEGYDINVRFLYSKKNKNYFSTIYFSDDYIKDLNFYEIIA